jgi:hypothetical protein
MREERKGEIGGWGRAGCYLTRVRPGGQDPSVKMDCECVGAQTRGREARAVGGCTGTHTLFVSARCAENSNI